MGGYFAKIAGENIYSLARVLTSLKNISSRIGHFIYIFLFRWKFSSLSFASILYISFGNSIKMCTSLLKNVYYCNIFNDGYLFSVDVAKFVINDEVTIIIFL